MDFHSWIVSAGKGEGKGEETVDWSFAVLELLREQGWDVKEMNDRYGRTIDQSIKQPVRLSVSCSIGRSVWQLVSQADRQTIKQRGRQ